MKTKEVRIPYGRRSVKVRIPSARLLGVLGSAASRPKGIRGLIENSFRNAGDKGLGKFVKDKKILVVVPDSTRNAHLKDILPLLLKSAGTGHLGIDITVATGLHKKHSKEDIEKLVGKYIAKKYKVRSHDQDTGSLQSFGATNGGIPIILNRDIDSHDYIISIGVIEPHLYAGYSGGAKTVAIGLAGEETISATHSVKFLDDAHVKIGIIEENPFQEVLWEIADRAGVDFSVNVVNGPDGKAREVFAGGLREVFRRGVAFSKGIFEAEAERPADIVICGVGHPKDVNLYQASRALNYILDVDRPVIKKGGVIIVAAEMGKRFGDSYAEKRFYDQMKTMGNPGDFISKTRRDGCVAGQHRAYMVARALSLCRIAFVTGHGKKFMDGLPFPYFKNVDVALKYADGIAGKESKIYVIPHALSTIARVKELLI